MSKRTVDNERLMNHYLTACYFKSKTFFSHLPDYTRSKFYRNLIRAIKEDNLVPFKKTIIDTLQEHTEYINSEKKFRKSLSQEQLHEFEELRKQIVNWYDIQKEMLTLGIGANEIIQISIQQQEEEEDEELKQKIKNNNYYHYGLEEFNREDENDEYEEGCTYTVHIPDKEPPTFHTPPNYYKEEE